MYKNPTDFILKAQKFYPEFIIHVSHNAYLVGGADGDALVPLKVKPTRAARINIAPLSLPLVPFTKCPCSANSGLAAGARPSSGAGQPARVPPSATFGLSAEARSKSVCNVF